MIYMQFVFVPSSGEKFAVKKVMQWCIDNYDLGWLPTSEHGSKMKLMEGDIGLNPSDEFSSITFWKLQLVLTETFLKQHPLKLFFLLNRNS